MAARIKMIEAFLEFMDLVYNRKQKLENKTAREVIRGPIGQ